jgi:putative membrane protein insertion efficiency factor
MRYPAIALVYAYRLLISPLIPAGTCKFHPSCSEYAIDALKKYGLVRGSLKAAWRLLRCNPWSHGGVDYA